MSRRVPLQHLRGSDPTLLEVQCQDLLRRPMGQLEPINVMDLIALSEHEQRPRSLAGQLNLFVERISASILDLPVGQVWDEYLRELEGIEGRRVPMRFRVMLERETERSDREPERVRALLARWAEQEPEPFQLGSKPVRVTRAVAVEPEDLEDRRPRAAKPRTVTPSQPKPQKVVTEEDRERMDWIAETVLERVRGAGEKGLGEQVLIAGVRHRARELYPQLTPIEITTVLRELKDSGRVRYSAGRWSAPTRW